MKTIHHFYESKKSQKKISMITCYDSTFAALIEASPIDCILVGDSAAMVMHGHSTTIPISTDTLALHVSAVRRGAPTKWIIGDMPFLSYRKSLKDTMIQAEKLMHAGAQSIKLEGLEGHEQILSHLVKSGIPVMGHLGLTPQSVYQLGGFKVQAQDEVAQKNLLEEAKKIEQLGCYALVLECVPLLLAQTVTQELSIPTIGIGAGPHTSGQVLVLQDLLGLSKGFKPKFLRHYLNGYDLVLQALKQFHLDVENQAFPSKDESYD